MEEVKEKKKKKPLGWFAKALVLAFAIFFIITTSISALLFVPDIQNFTVDRLTKRLSENLNGNLSVGKVKMNIFKGLVASDFLLTNEFTGDTVLYAKKVNAGLQDNLLSLIKRRIDLDKLEVSGLSFIDIKGQSPSYLKVADLFKKKIIEETAQMETDTVQKAAAKAFDLELRELVLNDFSYLYIDSVRGERRALQLKKATILLDSIILDRQDFYVDHIDASGADFKLDYFPKVADTRLKEVVNFQDSSYTVPDTFELYVNTILLDQSNFELHDPTRTNTNGPNEFDPTNIIAHSISLDVSNFYTNAQVEIKARINDGQLISGDDQIEIQNFLCEEFALQPRRMIFNGLRMETEGSLVRDNLVFKFRDIKDFSDFNNRVIMEGNIANSRIGIRELLYFAPGLKQSSFFVNNQGKQLRCNGLVVGRVNSLSAPQMEIYLDEEVAVEGRMTSRNLSDVNNALLNLELQEFSMTVTTLSELIPGFSPPPNFFKLGRLRFNGRFDGYFQDFVAFGDLSSDLGYADLDMRLDLKDGAENAQYSGSAVLKSFDLASWSGNDQFGLLEMEAEVRDGRGLRIESVNADLEANVNVLEYKGYVYEDFSMEGKFEKNLFDGNFIISDPNIDLDFSGTIDFTDSIPVYDFVAEVNALKLKKLNLLEEDFSIEGNLTINANGTDINNAQGVASGTQFILYRDGEEFKLDSFDLTAKGAYPDNRNFVLESSLADIELNGTFKIEELPDAFLSGLKTNYPNFTQQLTYVQNPNPSPGYDFNINMTIHESEDIFEVLAGQSIFIREATVLGRISDETNRSALDINFPFLEVNGNVFGGITGDLFAEADQGSLNLLVEYANINGIEFSPVKVEASAEAELLEFTITSAELLDSFTEIAIQGQMKTRDDLYEIALENTSFKAFGSTWKFNDQNNTIFGRQTIAIDNLVLSDGERALSFEDINEKGVAMNIKALNTSFFNRLTGANLQGEVNGSIEVADIFNIDGIEASLSIPFFEFEDHAFGRVTFEGSSNSFSDPLAYTLVAYDSIKNLRMDGIYDISSKQNSGNLRINNYPLDLLEYIIRDGLSETKGTVTGSLKYAGPFAYPELNGEVVVSEGSAKVDYLGTTYGVGDNLIKFSEGFIDFSEGQLIDSRGQTATVYGGMNHDAFRNFDLDISIQSPQFIGLNTSKEDNPSYYGFAQGELDVNFKGPFEAIDIAVNATTGRNTILNLPVEYTAEEYSTDFVEIIDYSKPKEHKIREEISLEGLSLDMKVNVTEDAKVVILFDETAKDILESQGRGAIQLDIDQEGNFTMRGIYEVVSGQYLFTIPPLVNKSFLIQNGGSIEWNGDPLDAALDIKATYRDLRTSLSTFLEEYASTERIANLANQRTEVSLAMDLGGTMSKVDIDFDISFPNLVGELKPLAEGKLRTLEANPDAYNEQIFGLILLRTFLPSSSNQVGNNILNTNNIFGTGYSTISEFISNQFSILLSSLFDEALQGDGYLTGVDVSLTANKNTLALTQTNNYLPDEYDFNFVSSFDEDKWNIQLGGSYVVNSIYDVGTYFAPDFVVEYYISEDRRLKLNLYARSDYDASRTRKIQSGVGLSYRKEFNNLFDLAKAAKEEASIQN